MKKLQTSDLFAAMRIVKASGIKDELTQLVKGLMDKEDTETIGITGALTIIEALSGAGAEQEIYKFLAPLAEKTVDEIKAMSLDEFVGLLEQIKEANDLHAFFTRLSGLMGMKSAT